MLQNIPQKMLILIVVLVFFSGFVCSNRASAWTVRLYVEGSDLGVTSVTIGVASEAKSIPAPRTTQDSVTLNLYSPKGKPLSVDIREEGNIQYTWIILVNPYGDIVPLDPNRTATLRWDFYSFSLYDLKDPTGLFVKLRDASDSFSLFLRDQFLLETEMDMDTDTRQLLSDYDDSRPPKESLQLALINEFNELLLGPSIYDKDRFDHVNLSQEAQHLIAQNPEGEDLICLNRLLFEEAYPDEIAKGLKFKAGTFELRHATNETEQIAVADMRTTKSYVVDAIRHLAIIFKDAENNEGDIETENNEDGVPAIPRSIDEGDSGGGGCFIVSCHSQK